jgi:hypothetical protein
VDSNAKAGLILLGLATVILLALAALTFRGGPWMLWADLVFGFVVAGLLLLGFYAARRSA